MLLNPPKLHINNGISLSSHSSAIPQLAVTTSPYNSDHFEFPVSGERVKTLWAFRHSVAPFGSSQCTSHLHSAELWGGGDPPAGLILTQCVSLALHRESAQQVEMEGTTATLTSRVPWTQRTSGGFSMTVGTLFSACTFANTSCCDGEHFFLCFGLLIPY